jgi:hypothetical protein
MLLRADAMEGTDTRHRLAHVPFVPSCQASMMRWPSCQSPCCPTSGADSSQQMRFGLAVPKVVLVRAAKAPYRNGSHRWPARAGKDAVSCRSRPYASRQCTPIPPTNRQRMIKKA